MAERAAADCRTRAGLARTAVVALAAAAVLGQIAYPLVRGTARDNLTVTIVIVFAAACLAHAWWTRGLPVALAVLACTAAAGFGIEVLGVQTGFPFGSYSYDASLGVRLWGVPVVIALAWTMLAWPAALVARGLARSFAARVILAAWALASWDLFLDPQMVDAGHWRWHDPAPHLPGVAGVPLTNYAGWLLASLVICLALQVILAGTPDADERVPYTLYLWTWLSSVLALAAFLDLPAAALWGGLGMGTVGVPLARSLLRPH